MQDETPHQGRSFPQKPQAEQQGNLGSGHTDEEARLRSNNDEGHCSILDMVLLLMVSAKNCAP